MRELVRSEVEELEAIPTWVLLFGRRKVGKTYIVQNLMGRDAYVSVRRDGLSFAEGLSASRLESPELLADMVIDALREGSTVVVDEFQRLPESFLDEVATAHPSGRLVLSGSSMRVVDKVLGSRSPLLALVFPFRLGLVRPEDLLISLHDLGPELALPYAAYLQEPWLTQLFQGYDDIETELYGALSVSRFAVPALVGEIFTESDRSLSRVYEGVIRALGAGLWKLGDIAHRLQNTEVIGREGSNYLSEYVRNLETMGLVESLPILGRKRNRSYRLTSPLLETFYYLADKHRTDERDRPLPEVRENLRRMVARAVERFVGRLLARMEDGQLECSMDPELDVVVTRGRDRRPVLVGEVKWGRCTAADVRRFAAKVEDLPCRKLLVTKGKGPDAEGTGIEVLSARELVDLAIARGD